MSFTTTTFDELILELGELATMRDDALRRPQIASSPALKEAVQALSEAVAVMVRTPPIASDAVQRTGVSMSPEAVVSRTLAYPQPGTNLLNIRVTDTDPEVAQALANGLADAFVNQVTQFERVKLSEGSVPEFALARIALSRAQRLFCPVSAMLADARAAEERSPVGGAPLARALWLRNARSRTV